MKSLLSIAEILNKDMAYVQNLLVQKGYEIIYDGTIDEYVIADDTAEKFLAEQTQTPDRYTKHGVECIEVIRGLIGTEGLKSFYIGNITKYLYRGLNIGDLKKARTYLDMLIKEVENEN